MILVAELRYEGQCVGRGDTQTLVGIVGGQVGVGAVPTTGAQFQRTEHVVVAVKDVEHNLSLVGESRFLIVNAQQLIVQFEFRLDIVAGFLIFGEVSQSYGVVVFELVLAEHGTDRRQHIIIGTQGVTVLILFVDSQVRHTTISHGEQVGVVLLVVCIGQRHIGGNLDAVGNEIVQCYTGGETVELLFDDRTCLMVVSGGNTEVSLLTTTTQGYIMVLSPTGLFHGIHPVGIIVVHLVFRELTTRLIVDFVDIVAGTGLKMRVEVLFLQHHGVLVTIEQFHALGLIGACQTVAIGNAGLASYTTLGLDLNDTIGTL